MRVTRTLISQVERGLSLFSTGEDSKADTGRPGDDDHGRPVGRGTRGHGFTDNPWGKRAREVVQSTKRLKEHNWAQIKEYALVYVQGPDHDSDGGLQEENIEADASAVSMRANIDID